MEGCVGSVGSEVLRRGAGLYLQQLDVHHPEPVRQLDRWVHVASYAVAVYKLKVPTDGSGKAKRRQNLKTLRKAGRASDAHVGGRGAAVEHVPEGLDEYSIRVRWAE